VATDDPSVTETLWDDFMATHARRSRDELVLHYSPLVKFVAGRVSVGLPHNVEQADLVSYGMFGLIDAIEKFDPARRVKFETYAVARIRGAIIDGLRSIDWVPRSVRAKARSLEAGYARLENRLRRAPTDSEMAGEVGMSLEELQSALKQISFVGVASLDEVVLSRGGDDGGEPVTLGDTVADQAASPGSAFDDLEFKSALGAAIGGLGEREKLTLMLYYYEGLTLAQIGTVLGVTESRVCQIHTKAVLALRSRLLAAEREPA